MGDEGQPEPEGGGGDPAVGVVHALTVTRSVGPELRIGDDHIWPGEAMSTWARKVLRAGVQTDGRPGMAAHAR